MFEHIANLAAKDWVASCGTTLVRVVDGHGPDDKGYYYAKIEHQNEGPAFSDSIAVAKGNSEGIYTVWIKDQVAVYDANGRTTNVPGLSEALASILRPK